VSLKQQLEILDQNHIIYYDLCFWIAKNERLRDDFIQTLCSSAIRKQSSLYLGQFRPFLLLSPTPVLQQLIGPAFWKL